MNKIVSRFSNLFGSKFLTGGSDSTSKFKLLKKLKLTKLNIATTIGVLFILASIFIVGPYMYYHYTNRGTANANGVTTAQVLKSVSDNKKPTTNIPLVTGYPTNISIPGPRAALDMNVNIIPGVYSKTTNTWAVSDYAAQFVPFSAQPNNISGNTFIYGHYRPNVFAYLHLIQPGTIATITTSNGHQFMYKYVETYAVSPTDTSVLDYSGTPVLTVQTCSGAYFQNRQMYIFTYVGYK